MAASATCFNCLTLTASVLSLPSATSWICCPPTLTLFWLNSNPAVPCPIVRPLALIMVSPKVALVKCKTLFKPIFTLVPSLVTSLVTVKLVSSGLKSTVSPGLTVVVLPWAVVRFHPLLAINSTSFSWLTFTASSSAVPAATPEILPFWSKATLRLITV